MNEFNVFVFFPVILISPLLLFLYGKADLSDTTGVMYESRLAKNLNYALNLDF